MPLKLYNINSKISQIYKEIQTENQALLLQFQQVAKEQNEEICPQDMVVSNHKRKTKNTTTQTDAH